MIEERKIIVADIIGNISNPRSRVYKGGINICIKQKYGV